MVRGLRARERIKQRLGAAGQVPRRLTLRWRGARRKFMGEHSRDQRLDWRGYQQAGEPVGADPTGALKLEWSLIQIYQI